MILLLLCLSATKIKQPTRKKAGLGTFGQDWEVLGSLRVNIFLIPRSKGIKKPPLRVPCGGGKCKKKIDRVYTVLYLIISKGIDKPAKEAQTFLGIEELAAGAYVVTFLCSHNCWVKCSTIASLLGKSSFSSKLTRVVASFSPMYSPRFTEAV